MTTFVALLRAVNVGGRTLAMADVRRSLEGLGLRSVHTYLQSGNVVFAADGGAPLEHAAGIEVRLERDLGPRVAVLVLTATQLADVVAANPFTGQAGADQRTLHATFLLTGAGEDDFGQATVAAYSTVYERAFRALSLPALEGERAAFRGAPPLAAPVVYLHLPQGYGRSKLTNAFFERKLGTAATTRNWRTVTTLAAMSVPASPSPDDQTADGRDS